MDLDGTLVFVNNFKSCLNLLAKENPYLSYVGAPVFYNYFVFYVGTLSITIPRRVETKLLTGDSKPYSEIHWINGSG